MYELTEVTGVLPVGQYDECDYSNFVLSNEESSGSCGECCIDAEILRILPATLIDTNIAENDVQRGWIKPQKKNESSPW